MCSAVSDHVHEVLDCVLLITHDDQQSPACELECFECHPPTHTGHLPSPPRLRRLHPTGNPDSSTLPSHAMPTLASPLCGSILGRCASSTALPFTQWLHHDLHGRRVSWCASNSSLLTSAGCALCLGLRASSLSSNCIGVATGSGTMPVLQQLTLLSWNSGRTVLRPCVPSPNMATNTLLGVSQTLPHLGPAHMK